MTNIRRNTAFDSLSALRNVLFVALAIALFLSKQRYSGPFQDLIHSYAGNVTVSFALYFVFLKLCMTSARYGRFIAAAAVLLCVESFEVFNGFGIMANTFDPFDMLANAVGAGCALGLDALLSQYHSRHSDPDTS